jgi:hypothetical protein
MALFKPLKFSFKSLKKEHIPNLITKRTQNTAKFATRWRPWSQLCCTFYFNLVLPVFSDFVLF